MPVSGYRHKSPVTALAVQQCLMRDHLSVSLLLKPPGFPVKARSFHPKDYFPQRLKPYPRLRNGLYRQCGHRYHRLQCHLLTIKPAPDHNIPANIVLSAP
ncbi:hypothetical protein D3C85_1130090 [compost metagenome]